MTRRIPKGALQGCVDDFVIRSFRDVADQDYISARLNYRYGLMIQFRWSALQAVEKYLKCILLFERKDTRSIGHKVHKALIQIQELKLPEPIVDFIKYLEEIGGDRYLSKPYYATGEELLLLDETVWTIRRFCVPIKLRSRPSNLAQLPMSEKENADFLSAEYSIFNGFLERHLANRSSELRPHLIWKNFFFGKKRKRVVKNFVFRSGSGNPTTYHYPEVYEAVKDLVHFDKDVAKYFGGLQNPN